MNLMLVLRSEIVCAALLILLLGYHLTYENKTEKIFPRICSFALAHVIFDGIALCAADGLRGDGLTVNRWLRMLTYLSVLCYCCEIFCYTLKNLVSNESLKKCLKLVRLPVFAHALAMLLSEIGYFSATGAPLWHGGCAAAGFAIAAAYNAVGAAMLLANVRKVEKNVIIGLLPCNVFVPASMAIQLAHTGFLLTGAAMTLVTTWLFFALENPAAHFMKRAYIDLDTGIKNRNCYHEDLKQLDKKYFTAGKASDFIVCAVCDINGLKTVNDNYGHLAGDEFIRAAAEVLSKNLKSAYNVYRIGGDEFIAIFIGKDRSNIEKEVAAARKGCGKYVNLKCPLSIAIGIAGMGDDSFANILDVISLADKRMYEDKLRIKQSGAAGSVR